MRDFTVIFFVDSGHGVDSFVEHVSSASSSEAFDDAVAQALGCSGHALNEADFEHATEIATFDGHLQYAA